MRHVARPRAPRWKVLPKRIWRALCRPGRRPAAEGQLTRAQTRPSTAQIASSRREDEPGKGGAAPDYLAYDGSDMRSLTTRRPFTILGIVLALLVIAAFVLVALNASTASVGQTANVVVATKDLPPRIPIDAGSLEIQTLPATAYQQLFFLKIDDVKGMIPLVTIVNGQAITSNL